MGVEFLALTADLLFEWKLLALFFDLEINIKLLKL